MTVYVSNPAIEVMARALWVYMECPWNFDRPPEGMATLQKAICIDQATLLFNELSRNNMLAAPPIRWNRVFGIMTWIFLVAAAVSIVAYSW